MNTEALKNLLYRMADDSLIIAHRNSEWTGLGPILEEDIAFSSIAQDKLGHALALYSLLHELGEADPDTIAFTRNEKQFFCAQLVEYPIGEYDFSLVRHFLFDTAEKIRYELLQQSSYEPLAKLAKKVSSEIKYHTFHAETWIKQLGSNGNEESKARIQSALNDVYPIAFSLFEKTSFEDAIVADGIFVGEETLQLRWVERVTSIVTASGLTLPSADYSVHYGGRNHYHTEYLQPLLDEMTVVFQIDPSAEW
jgi:ring-1,2-phenylacetyl-CoA epoxidase subunit PaaC